MQIEYRSKMDKLSDKSRTALVMLTFSDGKDDSPLFSGRKIKEIRIGRGKNRGVMATRAEIISLVRKGVNFARKRSVKHLSIKLSEFPKTIKNLKDTDLAELVARESCVANYEFNKYKKSKEEGFPLLESVVVCGVSEQNKALMIGAVERGAKTGLVVNETRDICNTPACDLAPADLVRIAKEVLEPIGVVVTDYDLDGLKKLGAGGLVAVGKGSENEPHMIVMEWNGGKKGDKPIAIVGKGITHDTGGYSIKPSCSMVDMHLDMSGGAAVMGAMRLCATFGIRKNVIGIVASAENMVSGRSYREGDIIRMLDGTTVEVKNTDAEGRIVLGDAIAYAKKMKPKAIIDIATLTGASIVALGYRFAGVMTLDERLEKTALSVAEEVGEDVWPLPITADYEADIKSNFADIANLGKKEKAGGATTGGIFLAHFAKGTPWMHIDMAPRMESQDFDNLAFGATGYGVQLLFGILNKM
ncbi:MAG: leucyl aminopeptidase [Candidatus Vogelbacteria bacterium CG10_big_fil_rev_8_21_14_0_10_45_14]|uniref:Leucyl aminopeptidase n=1 Tax=Candidatus Vogelbacteria bacterium CG10_big_fil_rev_8_21_14_0_10_45_14 TaxID=1975042 RepID=A0A2H0RKF6_9BACT|nr:MAG: leucyl aminopeptidase [Candidatus Vogelbacteria bacterium CG10_big_fil_rev_8_21_14_0_10_45_14]